MQRNVMAQFEKALARKAAAAGIDVSAVRYTAMTTDRTYGDRVGYAFHGASAEVNERVAVFFAAWLSRQPRTGSYEAQRSLAFEGVYHFERWSNGAQGWYRGALGAAPAPHQLPGCGDFVFERAEGYEGYAVSTTYYPDCDTF